MTLRRSFPLLLIACYCWNDASASLFRGKKKVAGPPFPRVYTAIVTHPRIDHNTFGTEIDLLDVVEMGLPCSGKGSDCIKLQFMVHSSQELDYLISLNQANEMTIDQEKTDYFHFQAALMRRENEENKKNGRRLSTISGFSCYKNLEESLRLFKALVNKASDKLDITLQDIGDSWKKTKGDGGYDIWALRVTGRGVEQNGKSTEKGILFVQSGLHAREYAPPELIRRWIETLINNYDDDAEATAILDHTEIHIVLQANPDGRVGAETNPDDYRRKNVNDEAGDEKRCGSGSYGVDLNRNYPFNYRENPGQFASSAHPCSETYHGSGPASEPEVAAIVNYCRGIFPAGQRKGDPQAEMDIAYPDTIKGMFIDVHSFGNILIYPWGHREQQTPNHQDIVQMISKVKTQNGYGFSGPGKDFIYPAAGTSDDWAYGELGVGSTTFELGTDFYQDCNTFINTILPKNIKALNFAATISRAPLLLPKGPDISEYEVLGSDRSVYYRIVASDKAWSNNLHHGNQGVSEVRIWINEHPDDQPYPGGQIIDLTRKGDVYTSVGSSDISNLSVGSTHSLYLRARDNSGFYGPVLTIGFKRTSRAVPIPFLTPAPTTSPTGSPTVSPSVSPSTHPSSAPTSTPSATPTSDPTPWPTWDPTISPTPRPSSPPSSPPSIPPSGRPSATPSSGSTGSPSIMPSALPSVSPSSGSPSGFPSGTPSIATPSPSRDGICDDSATARFSAGGSGMVPCRWLESRAEQREIYCDPSHPSDAYNICEETCGRCVDSCEDDRTASFNVNGAIRNCAWLKIRPNVWPELCVEGSVAWTACQESCENCPLETLAPSGGPTVSAAPTTVPPTTSSPTTEAPTTGSPTTDAPTTASPTTDAPSSAPVDLSITAAPTTGSPTTTAPTTASPTTGVPSSTPVNLSSSVIGCEDDNTRTFYTFEEMEDQSCEWLAAPENSEFLSFFCDTSHPSEVIFLCSKTCGRCDESTGQSTKEDQRIGNGRNRGGAGSGSIQGFN